MIILAQLSASAVTKIKKDQNLLPPHAHALKLIAHIACYPVLAAHDYYTKKPLVCLLPDLPGSRIVRDGLSL